MNTTTPPTMKIQTFTYPIDFQTTYNDIIDKRTEQPHPLQDNKYLQKMEETIASLVTTNAPKTKARRKKGGNVITPDDGGDDHPTVNYLLTGSFVSTAGVQKPSPKKKSTVPLKGKGVSWHCGHRKWQARYTDETGKRRVIGYYEDVLAAAKAYQEAIKLKNKTIEEGKGLIII